MPSDTESGAHAELDRVEANLRRKFAEAMAWLKSQKSTGALASMLGAGQASQIADTDDIMRAAQSFATAATESYQQAGRRVANYLAERLKNPVGFDTQNSYAIRRAQANNAKMVREITQETRDVINAAVREVIAKGMNPRSGAQMIRGSIGLTEKQRVVVSNYRAKLESQNTSSLENELRDRRFDGAVRAAASGGKPLTTTQIDTMVSRYQERFVAYRAEVVGRTEALRAVHQGTEDMWRQAIENGDIKPEQMMRTWRATKDPRTRRSHYRMNGQVRGFDEAFETPEGVFLAFPGDPFAPIEETAQCRCVIVTRFKPAAMVRDEAETREKERIAAERAERIRLERERKAREKEEREREVARQAQLEAQRKAEEAAASRLKPDKKLKVMPVKEFRELREKFTQLLTPDEKEGFVVYSSPAYQSINGALRGDVMPFGHEKVVADMDRGFDKASAPKAMKVLRGVQPGPFVDDLKPGDVFMDKAYISTTVSEKVIENGFDGGVIFHIEVAKGMPIAPIPSELESELEFLMPRGTRFQILEVVVQSAFDEATNETRTTKRIYARMLGR